jgi:hypothetical protein
VDPDPGWVQNQDADPVSGEKKPGSYFLELRNHFFKDKTSVVEP